MKKIIVIGGGLAGLVSSIELSKAGFSVTLFEKKKYPFHRVCGEYISNEVLPFLRENRLLPENIDLPQISQFELSSIKGKTLRLPLDLGGFGISRFLLDQQLAEKAREMGAEIYEQTSVIDCAFHRDHFRIETSKGQFFEAEIVIGSFGKSSILDRKLNRDFTAKRSPYLGVKYHIRTEAPKNQVSLHNFNGGYCGLSAIEEDKFNLCYLASRDVLKSCGSIEEMEAEVLCKNPNLQQVWNNSDFLFDKPEVINEFSFAPKQLIENHILMAGDAAGLITPLSGNGMAMAIHSGKILADEIQKHWTEKGLIRATLESSYLERWNQLFRRRLWMGRQTQKLFGSKISSDLAVGVMNSMPSLAKAIMKNTHGQPFQ